MEDCLGNIPKDRLHFKALTSEKVLIVGRHTFFETDDFAHLRHLRHVIVVSTTLDEDVIMKVGKRIQPVKVHLARSFDESLCLAKSLEKPKNVESKETSHGDPMEEIDIDCWIGGGQRLYEHAIRHVAANEIYLTLLDENSIRAGVATTSFFPAKYRWDNIFFEVLDKRKEIKDDPDVCFDYTFLTYRKKRKGSGLFTK